MKASFARVFNKPDWHVFKAMADRYFERSARLSKADMKDFPVEWRLLARNIEKRLFIGIGTELLLKAVYLAHGFMINKPEQGIPVVLRFPFTRAQMVGVRLKADETYMLNDLVQSLHRVPAIGTLGPIERGLRIAKVFRNKEGHAVVLAHKFNPQDYRDIEQALVGVYSRGFGQSLKVRFSLAPGERPSWELR